MYLALKAIHICAAAAFLGNISAGLLWKRLAERSGAATIIAHTADDIISADRIITVPSIIAIILAGVALVAVGGYSIVSTGWLLWGIAIFALSGLAFIPVSRAQVALRDAALAGLVTKEQIRRYVSLSRQWDAWGAIALFLPLVSLALMVMRPDLPAFHFAASPATRHGHTSSHSSSALRAGQYENQTQYR